MRDGEKERKRESVKERERDRQRERERSTETETEIDREEQRDREVKRRENHAFEKKMYWRTETSSNDKILKKMEKQRIVLHVEN